MPMPAKNPYANAPPDILAHFRIEEAHRTLFRYFGMAAEWGLDRGEAATGQALS